MAYRKGLAGAYPMKGVHTFLNEETLKWLIESLNEVDKAYDDVLHEQETGAVLDNLSAVGWTSSNDGFGQKMHRSLDLSRSQELRVTVVLKKDDTLALDIRTWKVG
jgi:hypothetical protein